MPQVLDVPLTTTLADLDEVLRKLLKRELGKHGFEGVEIAFDAPSRDWSGKLTGPTVNLFLYDIREASEPSSVESSQRQLNGNTVVASPALRLEVTYAITAWTKAVEDEHRLLSQILAILHTFTDIPGDILNGRAALIGQVNAKLGRPMEEKADFWTAVGGQYKPAVDYALTLALESGAYEVRGPEVRTQVVRHRLSDAPRRTMVEMTRFGGKVVDGEGAPLRDVWITLPELGLFAASNPQGRFLLQRVPPGKHKLLARTREGAEAKAEIAVPGAVLDLTVAPAKRAVKKGG
jgi:hypothetical protein